LKQAQECLELAANASDPDLRNGYLHLAKSLTELAASLHGAPGLIETGNVPRSPAGAKKPASRRNRTN
jgi:hypothetical protein